MIKKIAILLCVVCFFGFSACTMWKNSSKQDSSSESPYVWTDESASEYSTESSLDRSSESVSVDNSTSSSVLEASSESSLDSSVNSSSNSSENSSMEDTESSFDSSLDSSLEADKVYVITLNANGGSAEKTKVEVKYGDVFVLPTPTKFENRFLGWKIKGTNEYLTSGVYEFEEDIELVADWDPEWSIGF